MDRDKNYTIIRKPGISGKHESPVIRKPGITGIQEKKLHKGTRIFRNTRTTINKIQNRPHQVNKTSCFLWFF
jgi:hypothetical protein